MLATYRSSPHSCLHWSSPAEVLHGSQPKSLLSLFLPRTVVCKSNDKRDTSTTVVCKSNDKRDTSTTRVDCARSSKYSVADLVYARNYASGAKWFYGVITKTIGSMMYTIRTDRGLRRRHQNQLQPRLYSLKSSDSVCQIIVDFCLIVAVLHLQEMKFLMIKVFHQT